MALQKEIWIQDIQDQLFAGAEFVQKSTDHSEFVSNKTVHIPQSGANPTVTKDRSSFPATIVQRTDTDETYNLSTFDTEPILITDIDEIQTSYNKRQSVLGQHVESLNDRIALETAFNWAGIGAANIVRTTGAALADALAPGATGTRLGLVKADIKSAAAKLDNDNVSRMNRFGLLDTDLYYQLFADDTLVGRDFASNQAQEVGVINELYGFKLMARPDVVIYDNTGTPVKKAVGAATATTDNLAGVFRQQNFVSNALGDIKVFSDEDRPDFYGSIFSAMILHGSKVLRTDSKGIVTIVQA